MRVWYTSLGLIMSTCVQCLIWAVLLDDFGEYGEWFNRLLILRGEREDS